MKRVMFIADDFGQNRRVNAAILRAHCDGALQGASLMPGQPGTDEAVDMALDTPSLRVGWHLHLCDSIPLTATSWPWGESPAWAGWRIAISRRDRQLIRREIRAQWEAFTATGLECAFVNTHHHLHVHPFVRGELARVLPPDFAGWRRSGRVCFFGGSPRLEHLALWLAGAFTHVRLAGGAAADTLWGVDRLFAMRAEEVRRTAAALPDGRHEFIFHPRGTQGDADFEALLHLRHAEVPE